MQRKLIMAVVWWAFLMVSLGCSIGALIVQAPTPTPTPRKTLQPTFTHTPNWTATFTPSPTFTPSATPTETSTPTPTPEAEAGAEAAPVVDDPPPAAPAQPAPPPPTDTPAPTATPRPNYPFSVVFYTHDTGSPGENRLTGWIREDISPGVFRTLPGYQIQVTAPDGQVYLSEVSGDGYADSTMAGTGDNHWMNTKLEITPYTPGTYKVMLVDGGVQVSQASEVVYGSDPLQYIHFDYFRQATQ